MREKQQRRVCRSKTRTLPLTLTDTAWGRTSQGWLGFPSSDHMELLLPLDPAMRDVSTHHARARGASRDDELSFTLFEARSINFEIVVYSERMHVKCRLALSQLRGHGG